MTRKLLWLLAPSLTLFTAAAAHAYDGAVSPKVADEKVAEFKNVGITEKLGDRVNLDLQFKDENGQDVKLGQYFDGHKPVVLSLVYYECPGLCNLHLNGLVEGGLKELDWNVGEKFNFVVLSFDSKNDTVMASGKKQNYINMYKRASFQGEQQKNWPFLVGTDENIRALTDSVGFKYEWNEEAKEWMHASAAIILTPDGRISRYLHGVMFDGPTMKLALAEATDGKIGTFVEKMIWYCFKYDPHTSKYTLYAFRLVQIGAIITVLLLAIFLVPVWRRARKEKMG